MLIRTESLALYSGLQIGGIGTIVTVTSSEELREALVYAKTLDKKVHVIGAGTNSYFGESLSRYVFIQLALYGFVYEEHGEGLAYLTVQAGEIWDDVVSDVVTKGYRGLENLSYIPGTVGAAPVQNIGAYGVELADSFVSCEVFDMHTETICTLTKKECRFGYRTSLFKELPDRYCILSVTLHVSLHKPFILSYKPLTILADKKDCTVKMVRDTVIDIRISKLPDWKIYPNCGSFFKNPVVTKDKADALRVLYPEIPSIQDGEDYKVPAAWLIEHVAHLKGVNQHGVGTWPNQSLVIVNYEKASAEDLSLFVGHIQKTIFEKTGIFLEQEVQYIH